VFPASGTLGHDAEIANQMTGTLGRDRSIWPLNIFVKQRVRPAVLHLKTTFLKPPLRHWASFRPVPSESVAVMIVAGVATSTAGRALTSAPTSFGASLKTVCVERSDMGDDPHCRFIRSYSLSLWLIAPWI